MFLLLFMTLKYPLILWIHLKLFQKQYNSLIKKVLLMYKKGKTLIKGVNSLINTNKAPNDSSPLAHHTAMG